jgi:DNA repair protein RecN (Recombination protein N)
VAARGQQHFQVSKQQTKGITESSIAKLDVLARIEEVARMLCGIIITPTTLKHAQELLES